MFNQFSHFSNNFRNFGSISAFLALNGTLSTDANENRFLVNSNNSNIGYIPLTEKDFKFKNYVYQNNTEVTATSLLDIETLANNATVPIKINVNKNIFSVDDKITLNNNVPIEIDFKHSTVQGLITLNGNDVTLTNVKLHGGTHNPTGWSDGAGIFNYGKDNKVINAIFDDAGQRCWITGWNGYKRLTVKNSVFKNKNNNLNANSVFHQVIAVFQDRDATEPTTPVVKDCLFMDIPLTAYGNGGEIFTNQILPTPYPNNTTYWYTNHAVYGIDTNTIYENNIHVRCDGDGEILSIKSNGNKLKNLSFIDCEGVLSLRQGQNHTLDNIHFIGGSSGVRGGCKNVTITNLYSYNQSGDALGLLCGGSTSGNDTSGAWYQQCENWVVDNVTIIGGNKGIRTLSVEPDQINDLLPNNIIISNVAIKDSITPLYQEDRMTNSTVTNVVTSNITVATLLNDVVVPTDASIGVRFSLRDYAQDIPLYSGGATYLNNKYITINPIGNHAEFSIFFRLKLESSYTTFRQIVTRADGFRYLNIGKTGIVLRTDTSNVVTNFNYANIPDNEWTDIVLRGKANTLKTYINGVLAHDGVDIGAGIYDYSVFGDSSRGLIDHKLRDFIITTKACTPLDIKTYSDNPTEFFRHFNKNSNYIDGRISIDKSYCLLNMPLNEKGNSRKDYIANMDYIITNYTTDCDIQDLSSGLQKIAFDDSMIYTAEQMNFYSGDVPQYVQPLTSPLSIKETMKNGVVYLCTYDGTTQKLYKDGVEQTNATITEVNIGEISRLNGELESEIDTFELFNKVIKPSKYYKWITSNDNFVIVSNDGYILIGRN